MIFTIACDIAGFIGISINTAGKNSISILVSIYSYRSPIQIDAPT